MKRLIVTEKRLVWALGAALLLFLILVALRAGAADNEPRFSVEFLASNRPGVTDNTDSRLVDPWGLAAMRAGPWWIANGGSGRLTTYNGDGIPVPILAPLSVTVAAAPGAGSEYASPAGLVFNDGPAFELEPSEPAWFLIATRNGQVEGWFPGGANEGASLLLDQAPEARLTGAAISGDRLYIANFRQHRIDVYDGGFTPVDLGISAFVDPNTPRGLSPYNVRSLGDRIYVTYAAPDDDGRYAVPGTGSVAAFDRSGRLLLTLERGPWMNAPWGVVLAPETFAGYGNDVLVANTGSGRIAVFDPENGSFLGYLTDFRGVPVTIRGLHGLGFGNDDVAGPSGTLYFTAGPDGGTTGIFGAIIPAR